MRIFALALLLIGCNGPRNRGGVPEFDDLPDLFMPDLRPDKRPPTDHPEPILLVNNRGPVATSLEVYTVVWPGDEVLGERMNRFAGWLVTHDEYWTGLGNGEYGLQKGKAMGFLVVNEAKRNTIDDSAFGTLVKQLIVQHGISVNANTTFAFMVPQTTQSTMFGGRGCNDYGGYHSETRMAQGSNVYVPYSVNLQCSGFGGGDTFDGLTEVTSHELSETATDPHPFTRAGWVTPGIPLGGENSDLCAGLGNYYPVTFPTAIGGVTKENYFVTRNWSNTAVRDGHMDPCQPAPAGKIWFNVAPDPIDMEITPDALGLGVAEGVYKPFAYGDVGTIKWQVVLDPGEGIEVIPDRGAAEAGDTIPFKVRINSKAQPGTYPFLIWAQSQRGGSQQWQSRIIVN